MRQYERYLFMHLLLPSVLVTAALTGIIWLTQVMRFIDFMLNRGLTVVDFLYLTGLMLPNLLLMLIPIALGIAVIYTYNRLTSDSELVVLNAVGVSRLQLARPVLALGAMACLLCYVFSLWIMPLANHKFRDIRTFFRDKYASVLLEEDVFNTPINGITVFIRSRDKAGNMQGILLHDNRNSSRPVTMMAERGRMEQTANGPRFYLEDGVRQEIQDGRVSWLSFADYAIDIAYYAEDIQRKRDPDEQMLGELWHGNPEETKIHYAMRAEAHQRLTWPLLAIVLPLLALAFLSAGEFNRRGQAKRIIVATIAVIMSVLVYFALRSVIVKHPLLTPVLYGYVILLGAMSFQLLAAGRFWWTKRRRPLLMSPTA